MQDINNNDDDTNNNNSKTTDPRPNMAESTTSSIPSLEEHHQLSMSLSTFVSSIFSNNNNSSSLPSSTNMMKMGNSSRQSFRNKTATADEGSKRNRLSKQESQTISNLIFEQHGSSTLSDVSFYTLSLADLKFLEKLTDDQEQKKTLRKKFSLRRGARSTKHANNNENNNNNAIATTTNRRGAMRTIFSELCLQSFRNGQQDDVAITEITPTDSMSIQSLSTTLSEYLSKSDSDTIGSWSRDDEVDDMAAMHIG
mmetsp:Transcript_13140/g.19939  ORF Transcript_13140/g.19939 Transcript_13140/m.19939 type:complete len:254 (+) Transcript_13140:3083-3844(+)